MSSVKRHICFRKESGSFLPEIDPAVFRPLVASLLTKYSEDVDAGKIISHTEYFKRFYRERREGTKVFYEKTAGHEAFRSDLEAMAEMGNHLSDLLGSWVHTYIVNTALYKRFRKNDMLRIKPTDMPEATELVLRKLDEEKNRVDLLLHKITAKYPVLLQETISQKELAAFCDAFVGDVIEETDCEDAWYNDVSEGLEYAFGLAAIPVAGTSIEPLVRKHFHSWTEPDAEQRFLFADELAALAIKQLFEEKYGNIPPQ